MAAGELKDLRTKITPETWCVIEAEHRATGKDHAVIAREVLHGWAMQKIHVAKVTKALLKAEGLRAEAGESHGK